MGRQVEIVLPREGLGDITRQERLARLHERMSRCTLCQDRGYIPEACPIFSGRVTDRIMVIGQAPGRVSREKKLPFGGPSGKTLTSWLVKAGFEPGDFRSKVYLTSITKCDPGKGPGGNGDRKPSREEVELCRPFLQEEKTIVQPKVILLLGSMAIQEFLGPVLPKKDPVKLEDVVGSYYELDGIFLLPLPHSSGVSRWLNDPGHEAQLARALQHLSRWRSELGL